MPRDWVLMGDEQDDGKGAYQLTATCSLCGNTSSFDKKSLKASTISINGCPVVMCIDCEKEMLWKLMKRRRKQEVMR